MVRSPEALTHGNNSDLHVGNGTQRGVYATVARRRRSLTSISNDYGREPP